MHRRQFLRSVAAGSALALTTASFLHAADGKDRPNILWISAEDICPLLGCYGDEFAHTPNLDALAARGVTYLNAFSHAGVCAPARSGIITGVYPTTLGSHHMRSSATRPDFIRPFPAYLRDAGYYCSNNSKQDYNFRTPPDAWDESSGKAHWRKRKNKQQPFFSVFNFTVCHESVNHRNEATLKKQFSKLKPGEFHDPAKVRIPAYHPDCPEMRRDWARYYDAITALDYEVGRVLKELEEDGLADNTIVWFWGDHGTGMSRGKRWIYESGTHIPLLVYAPPKYRHLVPHPPKTQTDRLVSFIDYAPTMLSLAGLEPPDHMQGAAFLGPHQAKPRDYIYGIRDRMDEKYDCIRSVRNKRYRYIRNYNPHLTYNQYLNYLYKAKSMQAWNRLNEEGRLEGAPALYMQPRKPIEELYDVTNDPDEVHNLAGDPAQHERLLSLRAQLHRQLLRTCDLGFLDEAEMHRRRNGAPEYELGRDAERYNFERILETADLPLQGREAVPELKRRLDDGDSAVRYQAIRGLQAIDAVDEALAPLRRRLEDDNLSVRNAAADALTRAGHEKEVAPALISILGEGKEWDQLRALLAVESMTQPSAALLEKMASMKSKGKYGGRTLQTIRQKFE